MEEVTRKSSWGLPLGMRQEDEADGGNRGAFRGPGKWHFLSW